MRALCADGLRASHVQLVEGELHVECDGQTVVVGPRGTVRVPAGKVGRYSAPVYARTFAIYGPNPNGSKTEYGEYWDIPSDDAPNETISG